MKECFFQSGPLDFFLKRWSIGQKILRTTGIQSFVGGHIPTILECKCTAGSSNLTASLLKLLLLGSDPHTNLFMKVCKVVSAIFLCLLRKYQCNWTVSVEIRYV